MLVKIVDLLISFSFLHLHLDAKRPSFVNLCKARLNDLLKVKHAICLLVVDAEKATHFFLPIGGKKKTSKIFDKNFSILGWISYSNFYRNILVFLVKISA